MQKGSETLLQPFDIFTSPYVDFTGEIKTKEDGTIQRGMFMVIAVHKDGSYTACKITSNQAGNTYNNFNIYINEHQFLQANSYIQCDKLHTLKDNNCKKIGELNISERRLFISKLTKALNELRMNMEYYSPRYVSPNKFKGRNKFRGRR